VRAFSLAFVALGLVQKVANDKCHKTNGYEGNQSIHHIPIDDGHGVSKGGSTIYVNTVSHDALVPGPISAVRNYPRYCIRA
jgi:hypothetical protein